MSEASTEYLIRCPNCTGEHDASLAIWCSCEPQNPTKLCPFCLTCFCEAKESFRADFWERAPAKLREERAALKESRMLLGDMLVRAGVISTDQLLQGLKRQKRDGGRLGDALIGLGFLTRERIEEFLKVQQSVVTFDVTKVILDLGLVRQVGVEFCRRKRILPLEKEAFKNRPLMTLAMADPADAETINRVTKMSGCQVVAGRSPEERILEALETHFPEEATAPTPLPPPAAPEPPAPLPRPAPGPQPSPPDTELQHLVERLLRTGLERGADDLTLLAAGAELQVRYRIGGRVYRAGVPRTADGQSVLDLLRAMAGIGPSGCGRMHIQFGGGEVIAAVESSDEADDGITVRFAG